MNYALGVWQFLEAVEGLRLAALARLLVRAARKSYLPPQAGPAKRGDSD